MAGVMWKWALGLRVAWKIGSEVYKSHFMHYSVRVTGRWQAHGWGERSAMEGKKRSGRIRTREDRAYECVHQSTDATARSAAQPEGSQIRKRMSGDRAAARAHQPAQQWSP